MFLQKLKLLAVVSGLLGSALFAAERLIADPPAPVNSAGPVPLAPDPLPALKRLPKGPNILPSFGDEIPAVIDPDGKDKKIPMDRAVVDPVARPFEFPSATTRSSTPTRTDQSAMWFRTDKHIHFVLYSAGFLQTGVNYTQYGDTRDQPCLWKFRGFVNVFSGERKVIDGKNQWEHERKIPVAFDYQPPKLSLSVGGKDYDLKNGRVFVLNQQGEPVQLDIAPPRVDESDKQVLDPFAREVETALKKKTASASPSSPR